MNKNTLKTEFENSDALYFEELESMEELGPAREFVEGAAYVCGVIGVLAVT